MPSTSIPTRLPVAVVWKRVAQCLITFMTTRASSWTALSGASLLPDCQLCAGIWEPNTYSMSDMAEGMMRTGTRGDSSESCSLPCSRSLAWTNVKCRGFCIVGENILNSFAEVQPKHLEQRWMVMDFLNSSEDQGQFGILRSRMYQTEDEKTGEEVHHWKYHSFRMFIDCCSNCSCGTLPACLHLTSSQS